MAAPGGEARSTGEVRAEKNPEAAPRRGARFDRAWITARLDGDAVSVRISGVAAVGARTAGQGIDVTDGLDDLKAALADVLERHRDDIEQQTMEAAYESARIARQRGEEV